MPSCGQGQARSENCAGSNRIAPEQLHKSTGRSGCSGLAEPEVVNHFRLLFCVKIRAALAFLLGTGWL
jgi:hypothetical protein